MIPWDEKMVAAVSTAGGMVIAAGAVIGFLLIGLPRTLLCATLILAVFVAFRWVLALSLRPIGRTPAPAPDPAPAGDLDPVE